jgi:hypothetical protein
MTEPIDQRAYRRNVTARMVSGAAHFPVWQMPQRESEQGVTISYAQDGLGQSQIKDRFDDRLQRQCSTFGTIVSLASVWLETYHAFAPVVGA